MKRRFLLGLIFSIGILQHAALASPRRDVAAASCCHCRKLESAPGVQALSAAVLDFDGDGISEITFATQQSGRTIFSYETSSGNTASSISLSRGLVAPADYDGDGTWDAATVERDGANYYWNIKPSSANGVLRKRFGKSGDKVITGCRLLSADKYSLATFQGRSVFATEVGATVKKEIVFTLFSNVDILGCGDINGDGVDEIIFRSRGSNTPQFSDDVSTAGCVNDIVTYRTFPSFQDAFVIPRGIGQSPSVAVTRPSIQGERTTMLEGLFGTLHFFNLRLPAGTAFSSGTFLDSANTATPAVLWIEPGGERIRRKFLGGSGGGAQNAGRNEPRKELVRPQYVYDASELQ